MILCWRLPVARPPEATKPIWSEPRTSKTDPKGMGVISFAWKAFSTICLLDVARYRSLSFGEHATMSIFIFVNEFRGSDL